MVLIRFFKKDDKFYDLLEASAAEAACSVQLLIQMLKNPNNMPTLDEFIQTRRKDKRITEEITEQLCKTFVTPLEREDIESLSIVLSKIPKTVKKFSEKFLLCREHIQSIDFNPQIDILEQTIEVVLNMVLMLRKKAHLEQMQEQNMKLHELEGEADKVMLGLIRDMYSGKYEPLRVIIMMDLYQLLEKIIDRCRDAGNVIFQVVLKCS